VNLSTTAKDVQNLKNAISKLPDVREEKVQALRDQIEKGTYRVDADKVAEKMVGESLLDVLS
jgi:negative regulator of flagellin synthesis FlgM